jgi:hypothetical protein
MADRAFPGHIEEHELPCVEAMLASTLVLMTGYCQSLQAAQHPARRLHLAAKIGNSLAALCAHPQLSAGFHDVLAGLLARWAQMRECTAAGACATGLSTLPHLAAPERLH